jgi:hypothetical protein
MRGTLLPFPIRTLNTLERGSPTRGHICKMFIYTIKISLSFRLLGIPRIALFPYFTPEPTHSNGRDLCNKKIGELRPRRFFTFTYSTCLCVVKWQDDNVN